jgi:hypothetical protein
MVFFDYFLSKIVAKNTFNHQRQVEKWGFSSSAPLGNTMAGVMMSLGIGWNIVGRGEWGFPKQYKRYLSCEGRGNRAQGVVVSVG